MITDDLMQLFRKMDDLESLSRRLGKVGSPGSRYDVFQICNDGSMPTSTPAWFDAHPISISGPETEGGAATITYNPGQTIPVLVLGGVPSVGDNLPARLIEGRWVAEKRGGTPGGGGTGTCPGCSGTFPNTLNVSIPTLSASPLAVVNSGTGGTWTGCYDLPGFLGYAYCTAPSLFGLGKSTISSRFNITLQCVVISTLPYWVLSVDYAVVSLFALGDPSPSTNDSSRVIDVNCAGTCSRSLSGTAQVQGVTQIPIDCTRPVNLTFGAWTLTASPAFAAFNFYLGSGATVTP